MTNALNLSNGKLHCVLRPDLGGSIQSLTFAGVPVLRTPPAVVHTVRDMGCFPLVPFSNRVAKAKLQWNGTDHPIVKIGTSEEHAIHGVVWQRPWQVLDESVDFAMLSYEHKADHAWPFAFDVSQVFKLDASGLTMALSITNQAPNPAPVGLGWHPYFAKRASAHISFDATSRWEMGADKLPTVLQATSSMASLCAGMDIDNCFEGWAGLVELSDEHLRMRVESNLTRLVVYTKPSLDAIAIEPVSHANNAINLAGANAADLERLGVRVLASGETFTAQMRIQVSSA
jgi:aldose 1-epimerase